MALSGRLLCRIAGSAPGPSAEQDPGPRGTARGPRGEDHDLSSRRIPGALAGLRVGGATHVGIAPVGDRGCS